MVFHDHSVGERHIYWGKNRIIDKKVKHFYGHYIVQCILATGTILVILIFLDVLKETAIISALGASTFIIFTMPKSYSSEPRRLLGGYGVSMGFGLLCFFISQHPLLQQGFPTVTSIFIVFGALAFGGSFFIMALTNTEHPPAAGIALGLVINPWTLMTLVAIIAAVLWMAGIRRFLYPYLMDLTSPHLFKR